MKNLTLAMLFGGLMIEPPVKKQIPTPNPEGMKLTYDQDWKYFNENNSAMGYDADTLKFLNYMGNGNIQKGMSALGYDADFKGYNMPSLGSQEAIRKYVNEAVASKAMTAIRLRVFYTAGVGTPANVKITLFDSTFRSGGVFNSDGDLVFTNAGGDTATITCLTENGADGRTVTMEQLYDMTETEPFMIGFVRLKVKTSAQFDFSMGIIKDGQWGGYGGNSITPDDYVDPDQFQLLRVDIPMNVMASRKSGFTWTIDEDQTGTGIGMTLFIPTTVDPTKALSGQNPVRILNDGVTNEFYMPSLPTNAGKPGQMAAITQAAISAPVKQIMSSSVDQATGQAMIRSILGRS